MTSTDKEQTRIQRAAKENIEEINERIEEIEEQDNNDN